MIAMVMVVVVGGREEGKRERMEWPRSKVLTLSRHYYSVVILVDFVIRNVFFFFFFVFLF